MMKQHENQTDQDTNITTEANHKVGLAKINVTLASQQVDKALNEVTEIIKRIRKFTGN